MDTDEINNIESTPAVNYEIDELDEPDLFVEEETEANADDQFEEKTTEEDGTRFDIILKMHSYY